MKKPLAVIFNMPPRSGKDIAVQHLLSKYPEAKHLSYKEKLIEATTSIFQIDRKDWDARYDRPAPKECKGYKWYKDVPWDGAITLWGEYFSQRAALIHVSENVMKPLFGKGVFGDALASQIKPNELYFISDGGFDEEITPVTDVADVLVIKRDRLGRGWEGDSRDWISDQLPKKTVFVPTNISDLDEYLSFVETTVKDFINENTSSDIPR